MDELLTNISNCVVCKAHLPLGPRPIISVHPKSRIVIIGQAPGTVVHKTGIPWDDKSGENLRNWLGVKNKDFYNPEKFALIPMGFCYPGKGKSGDLPPRKECAPLWHNALLNNLKEIQLVVLIGKYAQDYYLKERAEKNLTDTVKKYQEYLPKYFVLPHPSPRNNIWQAKNEWFPSLVLPELKKQVALALD
jgi:uracil-DNA glycosylase